MSPTAISWTERVWNPTTGCDKVSPGCGLPRWDGDDTGGCYAMALARRWKAAGQPKYQVDGDPRTSGPGFGITEHPAVLGQPLRWRKPSRVFVNSMSDLMHDGVSREFIARAFAVMSAGHHTYQLLTKRHGRMRALLSDPTFPEDVARARRCPDWTIPGELEWPLPNLHLGVSVEDQAAAVLRVGALLETPAAVRWLSVEPMLGAVDPRRVARRGTFLDVLTGDVVSASGEPYAACPSAIDWVVVGGESGAGARPVHPDWFRSLRDQCAATGTAFHLKQWGAHIPVDHTRGVHGGMRDVLPDGRWAPYERHRTDGGVHMAPFRASYGHGRDLDGVIHDEYPVVTR